MKKRSYTLLLSLLGLILLGGSGCVIHDDDYYDPTPQPTGYRNVFNEEFSTDNRGWTFDDPADSAYAFVTGGLYKFVDYSYTGGTHEAVVTTSANFNRDFLIQTRIKSNYAMALIFGASGSSYGYSFFIDEAGYFAVYKEGYHPEVILDWQRSSAINSGFNDVEIEQINDYWYGYINGVKVFQTPARVLSGSKTGFMVLANTTGYADYLTVKW
jgi:hypothetical protein